MRFFTLFFGLLCLASLTVSAQSPVQWSFSAEKLKPNQYKINLVAKLQSGFHIFSLVQPEDAIAMPTKVNLDSNVEVDQIGTFKEEGKLEKVRDESLEIESWQFSGKVNFTGIVTLKSNKSKTILNGQVEFQVCDAERCYLPTKVNFSLPLNH